MKRNMSNLDRAIRVVLAVIFAYLYFSGIVAGTLGVVLVVLGAVFLLTAVIGFCPLYVPFKINTGK
ncbi:MAG: DUF2892 domain-containing protein [Anaerolineales bacterium]|nr:DUF2892 domain-containing protein [Anaerolineales bacterium]